MKKLTLLAACALTATMAYGQGKVQFANTPTTLINVSSNLSGGASGPMTGAGNYVVGLFVGAAGANYSSLNPVGTANNSGIAGRFSGGGSYVLPAPYDGSAPVAFQVRAWSVGLGANWSAVSSKLESYDGTGNAKANFAFAPGTYFLGSSSIGSVLPATGIGVPPALFGTGAGQVGGFNMNEVIPVPEPGTLALIGLGLTGLLFIRRRK